MPLKLSRSQISDYSGFCVIGLARLQDNDLAILRPFDIDATELAQHLVVHVGQDKPAASKLWSMVHQRRIAASPAASYRTPSSVVLSTALPIFYFRSYFASAILCRSPSTDRRWWRPSWYPGCTNYGGIDAVVACASLDVCFWRPRPMGGNTDRSCLRTLSGVERRRRCGGGPVRSSTRDDSRRTAATLALQPALVLQAPRARGTPLEPLRSDRRGLPIPRICRDAYKHARSTWPWGPSEKAAVLDEYEFSVLGRRPHRSRGSRLLYIRELPSF